MEKKSVYEIVNEKLIAKIEKAIEEKKTLPWVQPWVYANPSCNYDTMRPYHGINALLLDEGKQYITFKGIQKESAKHPDLKIKLKKGSKSNLVVFWKFNRYTEKDSAGNETMKVVPMLRYYNVFSVEDVENLPIKNREEPDFKHDTIAEAEKILHTYWTRENIHVSFGGNKAYYMPMLDQIAIPEMKQFKETEEFYSTCFHGTIHSTGSANRMNRFESKSQSFGSQDYSKEELVAEMGAAMLCAKVGINTAYTEDNSAAYLANWLQVVKNNPK